MGQWESRARLRCRFSFSLHGWALPSASPRPLMSPLRLPTFQLIPIPPTPSLPASNRAPIQTQPTLLYGQTAPASREPSLAPLVTKFVRSITRRPAALEERREALMALDRTPTPDKPTPTIIMEMLELTLGQLPPMFPSSTLLILSLQLILAMLSSLTNRNKAVCMP